MQAVIEIPEIKAQYIKQLAKQRNLSEVELMQQAIDDWLQQQSQQKHSSRVGFGLWKDNEAVTDGVSYQNQIRAEWDSH